MKVYQVIANIGNGCSWNSEYPVATYKNKEDAELHALYANQWNEQAIKNNFRDLYNPYDKEARPDINTHYGFQDFEVLDFFKE